MRELTQEESSAIQEIELDILIAIDRVCRQEKINYSLAFGTLLGAVKYKGFIPWDDDIDIMMPRSDYDRFLEVAPKKLEHKFFVVNYRGSTMYAHPFSKVMARNTVMKELSTDDPSVPQGIWVDVFPIDIAPANESLRKKFFKKAMRISKALFCVSNYTFGKKGFKLFLYRLKKIFYMSTTRNELIENFEKLARIHGVEDVSKNIVMNLCENESYEKATFKKKWFENYVEIEFENNKFLAIKDYDEFLSHIYGDYMTLPPVDKRIPHHYVCEVDFKSYKRGQPYD